jgi:glutathione S-transferase
MKVYGNPLSPATRTVLTTLAEKGQEAEFVLINFAEGAQKRPEHLARNPFGVVPVLEDDGFTLYESRAILRYLDRRFPAPALTPGDARARGLMEQFISVEQSYLTPHVMTLVYAAAWRKYDQATIDKAKADLQTPLDVADAALKKGPFLAGDGFSLADIAWMPYVKYLFDRGVGDFVKSRPHLDAWWQRASARPSWFKESTP